MSEDSSKLDALFQDILDELAGAENTPSSELSLESYNSNSTEIESKSDSSSITIDTPLPHFEILQEEPIRKKKSNLKKYLRNGSNFRRFQLVRTDIRDNYSSICVNALNSLNLNTIITGFSLFCSPTMVSHIGRHLPGVGSNNFMAATVIGPMWLSHLMYSGICLTPDGISTIEQSKFYSGSENGVISFTVRNEFTKIHNYATIHHVAPKMMADKTSEGAVLGDDNLSRDSMLTSVESLVNSIPLRQKPLKCVLEVKVMIHTDPLTKYATKASVIYTPLTNHFSVE